MREGKIYFDCCLEKIQSIAKGKAWPRPGRHPNWVVCSQQAERGECQCAAGFLPSLFIQSETPSLVADTVPPTYGGPSSVNLLSGHAHLDTSKCVS